MDPITAGHVAGVAFSIAIGAFEVGEGLYTFIQDVKQLESTTSAFAGEIKALGAACRVVSNRLQDIVKDHESRVSLGSSSNRDSFQLWSCLEDQISDCQKTISQLQEAVSCLKRDPAKGTNFVGQVVRQIKLHMKAKDITEARNRIRSHTASLQILLQSIAIEIAYVVPQRTDQQLRTHLAELTEVKQKLELLRAERDPEDIQTQKKQEEDVLRASEQVISSGETLYASSVASGSMLGELAPGKKSLIYDWMENANAIESSAFRSVNKELDADSSFSAFRDCQLAFMEDTASSGLLTNEHEERWGEQFEEGGDLDSEDSFTLDAAQQAIITGREAFQRQDYTEASATLGEAFKIVRELPVSRQTICDPCEMRYMLGVCAFYLEEPLAAEVALLAIIENTPKAKTQDDARRLQVCDAGHLLSLVYIRLGRIDQARLYCENALQGRRRLLGKTSDASYESLALMAKIFELNGNTSRSKIVNMMIPDPKRENLVDRYKTIGISAQYSPKQENVSQGAPRPFTSSQPAAETISKSIQGLNLGNESAITVAQSRDVPVSTVSTFPYSKRMKSYPLIQEFGKGRNIEETLKLIPTKSDTSNSDGTPSLSSSRRTGSYQFGRESDDSHEIEETNELISRRHETSILGQNSASLLRADPRPRLTVTIIAADGLYKPELFRLPDTCACMSIDGGQIRCTAVVSNTLNPYWNQSFDVHAGRESILKVAIFDKKTYQKQGSLGSVKLRIGSLINFGIKVDEIFTVNLDKANHFGLPIEGRVTLKLASNLLR